MFITGIYMTQSDINSKFVEFLNDAYAAENAAIDRINSRIEETPFPELLIVWSFCFIILDS